MARLIRTHCDTAAGCTTDRTSHCVPRLHTTHEQRDHTPPLRLTPVHGTTASSTVCALVLHRYHSLLRLYAVLIESTLPPTHHTAQVASLERAVMRSVTVTMLSIVICLLLLSLPFSAAQSANSCSFSSLKAQGYASSLIVSSRSTLTLLTCALAATLFSLLSVVGPRCCPYFRLPATPRHGPHPTSSTPTVRYTLSSVTLANSCLHRCCLHQALIQSLPGLLSLA